MSRTFRRKGCTEDYYWVLRDWDLYFSNKYYDHRTRDFQLSRDSKEAIKALAKYHSDAGTDTNNEPGPAQYRLVTRQIPLRRDSARQLRRYLQGEDFEVIIGTKPPLEYWT